MTRYVQIRMPDGSIWEAPFEPLIQKSIALAKEGDLPENVEEYQQACLDAADPMEISDDLRPLSWKDVASLAVQVEPPDAPPYAAWWKDLNYWHDVRFVEKPKKEDEG